MSLLIVESPAKCQKIQGFLGAGWRVIATMGHIRSLEENVDAVGLERDFEPRFQWIREKSKAIQQIKDAAAKATKVYLASDDDREGEAISYSVAVLLNLNPATTPRAVFHEITATAVRAAVDNPRRLDMAKVNAQQARAVLDMMVGFTISPLLWKYVGQALSAGRCQTPALRILVDQEKAIQEFTASTSWRIKGAWSGFQATMTEDLEDEESAMNYLENIHDDTGGLVKSAITKPTTEQPPKPLITSTLQQEASATMSLQPKRTMQIAQRLYEAGHITYMRTDSAVLSEEARVAAEKWVREAFGEEFVASAPVVPKSKPKSTQKGDTPPPQEAHEAIRPTHIETRDLPTDEDWSSVDQKLYRLIWNRAVQSVMKPAKGEQRTVEFVATADPMEFLWKAVWKRTTFLGWRKIGAAATNLDEEDEEEDVDAVAWKAAEKIVEGVELAWTSLEAAPHETKAGARYTEATLVRELERKGIGRPSTFASLVGTVIDKGYAEKRDKSATEVTIQKYHVAPHAWPPASESVVQKVGAEKQKLVPTALGTSVLDFCLKEFPGLFDYDFTKRMESRLDAVATGAEQWKALCSDTWDSYKDKYKLLKSGESTTVAAIRERKFANGIKAIQSKKGPLLLKEMPNKDDTVFYGWPEGATFQELTEEIVATFIASKVTSSMGEYEGHPMVKKSGPYGAYVVCNGVNVPFAAGDTEETIRGKLAAKGQAAVHTLGAFEFRTGPYGVFMFKKDLVGKARKFVSIPTGVDPKTLTQEAAIKIYQTGLQSKAKAQGYKKKT
jgi:DNA topoisomerase-1